MTADSIRTLLAFLDGASDVVSRLDLSKFELEVRHCLHEGLIGSDAAGAVQITRKGRQYVRGWVQ